MTDISDCESDAGASPSVSSDESGNSSSSGSSTPNLKIVTNTPLQSTPKKRGTSITTPLTGGGGGLSKNATPGTSSSFLSISASTSGICSTPISSERKPVRRRQLCTTPTTPLSSNNTSSVLNASAASSTPGPKAGTSKCTAQNSVSSRPTSSTSVVRKRKRPSSKVFSSPDHSDQHGEGEDSKSASAQKRKRNKRRRTRSERNFRAGKAPTVAPGTSTQVVAEGEEAVALDAEIDRVLEEKAIKNNLSATNVKSIIRHVITNNMVQKMIMSAMRKKAEVADAGGSSDEDGLVEPKMTRAKTKELLGKKQISLWPIVDSPVKKTKKPVSETHILIHNDLPEDSSGDEEYVPKETDISEIAHSDDESSSISHTSDAGSPYKHGFKTRLSVQADKSPLRDNLFKTPPPRPKNLKKTQVDSAISLRTRSKLPLNDTQLEDLERQLVPPDITPDMYDWGTQTDNEDYLAFLKDFLNPGQNQNDANDDDDPEYNVMEDDEDLHDKEELRRDRAVKVPKKELTQLIAELFENGGILSGDDMDDDLETLTGITPLVNDSGYTDGRLGDTSMNTTVDVPNNTSTLSVTTADNSLNITNPPASTSLSVGVPSIQLQTPQKSGEVGTAAANFVTPVVIQASDNLASSSSDQVSVITTKADEKAVLATVDISAVMPGPGPTVPEPQAPTVEENVIEVPEFRDCDLKLLQHQLRQHLQLLTQSYVLTVTSEDPCLKRIAKSAKMMVIEVKNFSRMNGPQSNFSVCNLDSAWNIVNFWPHKFLQQSPIKKKILEEKYISDSCVVNDGAVGMKGALFPRHVVKVIAENPAFMYNNLLPERYSQKNMEHRCTFSYSEDALLVGAMEELKDRQMTVNQMATIISNVLLVAHPPSQLFHRIRNLKKTAFRRHPSIKAYFEEGILPIPDRTVPELKDEDMLPLLQRDRKGLSHQWAILIQHIEDYSTSTYKWEQELRKDPITKSMYKKTYDKRWRYKSKKHLKEHQNEDSSAPVPGSKLETVNRVFPNGALIVDQTDPHTKSIPILDAMGQVGAIIHVPRLCLVTASPEKKIPEGKAYHPKEEFKRRAQQFPQPLEAQEAGVEPENHPQSASSSNENLIRLNNLLRSSLKSPKKNTPNPAKNEPKKKNTPESKKKNIPESKKKNTEESIKKYTAESKKKNTPESKQKSSPEIKDNMHAIEVPSPFKIPQAPPPGSASKQMPSFSVIQVVGKPFDLPELGMGSNQVIELSALQTPLKKKIFEKVAEQELSSTRSVEASPTKSELYDDSSVPPDSPNVIMEGTEVELSSDEYEDEEDEVDLRCHEAPEMILLSSDDDEGKTVSKAKPMDGGGGGGSGSNNENRSSNSPPKKTESCNNKQGTSTSSQSTVVNTTSRKCVSRSSGKDDSDDDDKDRKPNSNARKRNLPKDFMGEDEKEKPSNSQSNKHQCTPLTAVPSTSPQIMQAPPVPSTSSQSQLQCKASTSSAGNKQQKKARKSPGNQASKSRVSKYNVTQPENMLQESSTDFDDASDAYMEAYLSRVQAATEANHPGIYTAFVQALMEAGETTINQQELHGKIKVLFKDYPDLLKEFESFLDPSLNTSNEASTSVAGWSSHDQTLAEINFIQMVEKYTANCPALKAKIMNKFKSLKENPNFSEKELATAMEPFFTGNPVMMEAFKALLPSVYRPQSLSSGMDFEVIELDLDDPPRENNDDMQFEIVKLPDETQVPATNTCPCVCHTKTSNLAFANRSKHCRKCSLKFQDGKIYIHNGRVMRPVSVELAPAPVKHAPSTSSAATSRSRKDSSHHHHHHHGHPPPLHPPNQHQSGKPKEFKEPSEKKSHGHAPSSVPQSSTQALVQASSSGVKSSVVKKDDSEVDSGGSNLPHQKHEEGKAETCTDNASRKPHHKSHHQNQSPPKSDKEKEHTEWTEEEDVTIFTICQQEPSLQVAWKKIAAQIPHRTLEQLKSRFSELIELIKLENNM